MGGRRVRVRAIFSQFLRDISLEWHALCQSFETVGVCDSVHLMLLIVYSVAATTDLHTHTHSLLKSRKDELFTVGGYIEQKRQHINAVISG